MIQKAPTRSKLATESEGGEMPKWRKTNGQETI